jgi:capsular exopolysaccharide synthesis family protein
MSRLHGALQRATDGKAQLVPPDASASEPQPADASQPAFSVPWKLDPAGSDHAPVATPVIPSSPRSDVARSKREVVEKLVSAPAEQGGSNLGLAVEQYRKLAAALHHAQADRGLKLIMVASANPGEGKSLTASNLALTLSESYQRSVLLIDADLRRPAVHEIFGIPNGTGLSDGLTLESVKRLSVIEVSPRLAVLPSGQPMLDPTSALTSAQMRRVLDEARASYDFTIIDTPPIGLLSDAKLLVEMVDGVVLVIEAAKTPYPELLKAIEVIGRDHVLGAVLNRSHDVSERSHYYAHYYNHYYRRSRSSRG